MGGQVTGRVMVRPVRLGMVFEPSLETLRAAVEQTTLIWGGLYDPVLDPQIPERLMWEAARLGVDVLWPLDQSAAANEAAKLDGYQWRGHAEWSPLAPATDFSGARLLGPERLIEGTVHEGWTFPHWATDDPLADMFSVMFGWHGSSSQAINLERQFAARSTDVHISPEGSLPVDMASWLTPILATGSAIEYSGLSPGTGFIIVDPASAVDLMALWNLRAYGAKVFPWPTNHESRINAAARAWLQQLLDNGELREWRRGDGQPLGPHIRVWSAAAEPPVLPGPLAEVLDDSGIQSILSPPESAPGWQGDHPFMTDISHAFSQPLEADTGTIEIPVPAIGGSSTQRGQLRGDVIAVQLEISSTTGVNPDWTFSVPNVRRLAPLLSRHDGVLLHFDRPTADGRALSASSVARTIAISAIPSAAIFGKLIEANGWSSSQTPGGIFITRLIERLGGPGGTVASQPGARAGLLEVARSQQGRPSGAIVERIKQYRGSWPDPFASAEVQADYPASVFRYLLSRGILRPALPIVCPHCTTSTAFRPEDLAAQMKCEMCLQEFPLGLALGMATNGRNDWHYQLAGHVGEQRLSEALPVMATLQVLTFSGFRSPSIVPYVLGWKVQGPGVDCEIDIATTSGDRGLPMAVIGEVKNQMKSIDENDLQNLGRVQSHLRAQSIECFVLAAVLRTLRPEEIEALREFANQAPETLPSRSSIELVLPIVLTEEDLSSTRLGEHPMRWSPPDGLIGLARESCRRNLGMTGVEHVSEDNSVRFRPKWS
jgi:hypothetical protein